MDRLTRLSRTVPGLLLGFGIAAALGALCHAAWSLSAEAGLQASGITFVVAALIEEPR